MALVPHEQYPVSVQTSATLECGIYATMHAKYKWREAFNQNLCFFVKINQKSFSVFLMRLLKMFL